MNDQRKDAGQTPADAAARPSSASSASSGLALRNRAEEQARTMVQTSLSAQTPEEIQRLLHELQVHQIELEMQNEELRLAQEALVEQKERYFNLYDLAPVGYCTLSEEGLILEINLTATTLLGVPRGGLVKQPISRFILAEDQDIFYLLRRKLVEAGEPRECELRLIKQGGACFWAHLTANLDRDKHGSPVCRIVLSDITGSKLAEEELRRSESYSKTLLNEVHHRVKNNLQVIVSLLSLEKMRSESTQTMMALSAMQDRIRAMAVLHESLYRCGDFAGVDLGTYLGQVARQTFHSVQVSPCAVQLRLTLNTVVVELDAAMACGLLLCELISNSLKHGFPEGRTGEVCVTLHCNEATAQWCLRVSDTGIGLPADFATSQQSSLGLQLVAILSSQLEGHFEIGPGAVFAVTFEAIAPSASSGTGVVE